MPILGEVENLEDMMRMLADAPEDQRKSMMKSRLEMVAAMPEDQRLNAMSEMISAIAKFSEEKRKRMIASRNRIIAEFPPGTRDSIMKARVKLAMKLPKEVNETDMMTMMQLLPELPEDLRMTFVNSIKHHMEEAGMPMPAMPGKSMTGAPMVKPAAPSGPVDMVKAQEEMMRQLASVSEEMRRTGLKGRWDEILKGSDQSLGDSIKVMMQALSRLTDDQRRTLIRTRTDVIGSLNEDQIKRALGARGMAMKGLESLDNEDKMITMEEMPWVPEGPRMRFSNTMMSFMKSMGMPPPPMPSTPVHHGKPMEKKGFFTKSLKCTTCGRGLPTM
jgi:hypothetical protein